MNNENNMPQETIFDILRAALIGKEVIYDHAAEVHLRFTISDVRCREVTLDDGDLLCYVYALYSKSDQHTIYLPIEDAALQTLATTGHYADSTHEYVIAPPATDNKQQQ